ncbi:MAG: hypothetical protein AAF206_16700 [Bacteroidota bacterium]
MKETVKVLKARPVKGEGDVLQSAGEILALFHESRISRFLIHARHARCHSTNSQMFFFANESLRQMAFDSRIRVGMLVAPRDDSYDFLQLVCHNAGYQLRVFSEENSAMSWLLNDVSVN